MIKTFNYSKQITRSIRLSAKNKVDYLIKSDNYAKNFPSYQTWENLHTYDEFKIFLDTFIDSCFLYLNKEVDIKRIKMWCFVDCAKNNSKKNQEDQWHHHSDGTNKLSGIFYLINHRKELTEFKDFEILNYDPSSWYIYPSTLVHKPPKIKSIRNRYTIAADLSF